MKINKEIDISLVPKRELICFDFIGNLIYSEEYEIVGKVLKINYEELVCDCIDGSGLFYCNKYQVSKPLESDIEKMFEV